jgi:branched-chain amino acid transport system permease protein
MSVSKIVLFQRVVGVILILFLTFIPWLTTSRYFLHILIMIFFYGYLAMCWNILGGYAGQHSFGHAAFVGIGAYTSTLLFAHAGLTPWFGMLIGGLLAGLAGLFIGYVSFHYGLKGPYFLLVTIAFGEVLVYIALNTRAVGGASGISIPIMGNVPKFFQFQGKTPYYFTIMLLTAALIEITYAIQRSRMGYYWIAIRENEDAAQILGVNVMRYKLWAVVLSAFFSGLGGTFYAQYFMFIDPPSILGLGLSVEIVIYVIVGGIGTILGPLLGSFLLFPLAEVTRAIFAGKTGGIHLMVYGIILVISIIFMPRGIVRKFSKSTFWPKGL